MKKITILPGYLWIYNTNSDLNDQHSEQHHCMVRQFRSQSK